MAFLKKLFAAIKKKFRRPLRRKRTKIIRNRKKVLRRQKKISGKKVSRHFPRKLSKRISKSSQLVKIQKKMPAPRLLKESVVGEITHFFSKIRVCVIKVTGENVVVGDTIRIKGATTNFVQQIRSLQIENSDVKVAHHGQLAGLKVDKKTRTGDTVFKVVGR